MAFCRASPHRWASHALLGLARANLGLPKGHLHPSTPPLPFLQTLLPAPPHRRHRELPRGLWVEEEAPGAPMPGACPSLARVLLSLLDHFLALCPLFVMIFPRPCSCRACVLRWHRTGLGAHDRFPLSGAEFQNPPNRVRSARTGVSTDVGTASAPTLAFVLELPRPNRLQRRLRSQARAEADSSHFADQDRCGRRTRCGHGAGKNCGRAAERSVSVRGSNFWGSGNPQGTAR